jgi:hypothetical protein
MSTGDRDARPDDPRRLEEAPDVLDRLLAELRVPVAPGFTRQVMSRLPERAPRRERAWGREWTIAAAIAAVLIALAAVVLAGGESGAPGVATSIVDLVVATFAAGAGFLAASWRGLGATVNAALDGSASALLALGLAALAANALLFVLVRRRRAAAKSKDDH